MKETLDISGRTFEVDGPLTLSLKAQVIQTLHRKINRASPATCPSNVVQNSNHQITFNITGGVPPYTYTVLMDGVTKAGPVSTSSTTWSVPVTFSEAIGTHTVLGRMVDSCGTPQTATDQCTINITAPVTTGSISCTTLPAAGASILLDNVLMSGLTPTTLTNVSTGPHTVTFKLAGYNDCVVPVNVAPPPAAAATATCNLIPIAFTICTWLTSIGGPTGITVPRIFKLVDNYVYQSDISGLGFVPTNQQIMGCVDYYLGPMFYGSGNSKTGCSY